MSDAESAYALMITIPSGNYSASITVCIRDYSLEESDPEGGERQRTIQLPASAFHEKPLSENLR